MKNKIYKAMVAVFAVAVMATAPAATLTTYAIGFDADAGSNNEGSNGEMPDDYWGSGDSSSNESSTPAPAPEPAPSEPEYAPSQGNSSSSNSSSNAGSYNNGSGNSNASANHNVPSSATVSATTAKKANDVTVSVTGGQKFRIVTSADYTTYQVYHCGISRASFTVADANGNAVAFNNIALEKGEDGLWYLNVKFAEGVDTKGFTVTVAKGDATYLSTTLGVSGIKVNATAALSTVPAADAE